MNAVIRAPEANSVWDVFGGLDNVLDGFFRPARLHPELRRQARTPAIDVVEKDGEYVVKTELPGVKKQDLDVTIQDGVLTINAESKYEDEERKDGRVIRQERHSGKYVRSMRLGNAINDKKIQAHYKDGLLELVLPKAEEAKPKSIDVKIL